MTRRQVAGRRGTKPNSQVVMLRRGDVVSERRREGNKEGKGDAHAPGFVCAHELLIRRRKRDEVDERRCTVAERRFYGEEGDAELCEAVPESHSQYSRSDPEFKVDGEDD